MTQRRAEGWAAEITRPIGRAVRELRGARGLSGEGLLGALREVGVEWSRSTLTNLEADRRESIGVHEVYALAAVLDVPPLHLLIPDPAAEINVLPDRAVDGMRMLAWITGTWLPGAVQLGDDLDEREHERRYRGHAAALDLLREHETVAHDLVNIGTLMRRSEATDQLYDHTVSDLREVRAAIVRRGWPLPALPLELDEREVDHPDRPRRPRSTSTTDKENRS